ncbi:MAG: metal ABC transporter solute-binding protein, Zn/Mn family [Christensenellales bacterium]|jgi:manganese/zinc/iron transport system substrate-binding protein
MKANRYIKKAVGVLAVLTALVAVFGACGVGEGQVRQESGKLNIVATTTMLKDLALEIGAGVADVNGLMGPGIDPHLYKASAGDVELIQRADVVIYNGIGLEGKMNEVFASLPKSKAVISAEDGIRRDMLLASDEAPDTYDPHIWFDVALWKEMACFIAGALKKADADNALIYDRNLESYLLELDELEEYVKGRVEEIDPDKRILITAHDAFRYFGRAYGFEVKGLQGISTEAEAGTADVSALADYITQKRIKAIFIESSVSPKTIEALKAAVKARGFDVETGGQLYSDALGDEAGGAETYILTMKANIDVIVEALK